MKEKVLEAAIGAFIPALVKEFADIFENAKDEAKQLYNQGLRNYFTEQKERYSRIKTILRGNTPIYFYDIYFPIGLRKQWKNVETDKVSNLFEGTNCITILGSAGSGKSMLVKHLFLNSITEKYAIPVLVELRHLNDYRSGIKGYIEEIIFENKISQNLDILNRLLGKGKFIFFLDGFDEISGELRGSVIKEISSFINEYGNNKFVLTSRPYANVELLPLFHNCQIQSLSKEEIIQFISWQLKDAVELSQNIIESINNSPPAHISSFLSNPLLLSLYILTFQSNSDIPNKKYIFYRRVTEALFSKHDSQSKFGFVREKTSRLSLDKIEEILKRFSFVTFFESKYDFEVDYVLSIFEKIKESIQRNGFDSRLLINDLKLAISLWVEEGNQLKFAHRSLQEYFAAFCLKDLDADKKESVYRRLYERLSEINEINNFVSLCEEMDEAFYLQFFLIPCIDKMLDNFSEVNSTSTDDFLRRIFTQTYSSIGGVESYEISTGNVISRHDYHSPVKIPLRKIKDIEKATRPLYLFLSNCADEIAFGSTVAGNWHLHEEYLDSSYVERYWWLDIDSLPSTIVMHLKKVEMLQALGKAKQNLLEVKAEKEKKILDSGKGYEDLLDMIL